MFQIAPIPLFVVVAAAAIATVTDLWKFKVYNALTLPVLGAGLLYHTITGGFPGLLASLTGIAFGFGILITFYVMGGVGAGDVKLMAAIGAWLGMPITFYVFIASAAIQAIYSVVLITIHGSVGETMTRLSILWYRMSALSRHLREEDRIEAVVTRPDRRRRLVPFGAALAAGFVATLLYFRDGRGLDWPPYDRPAPTGRVEGRAMPMHNLAPAMGRSAVTLLNRSASS